MSRRKRLSAQSGAPPQITATNGTIDGTTTDGLGITLDGGGKYQGLYVYSDTAVIENLSLNHTAAHMARQSCC
jgi:hypothetical protein